MLRDREQPLELKIAGWKQQLRGNGRLFLYLVQTYEEELRARAQVIWRNLQRAHASFGAPVSDQLRHDLLNGFRGQLDDVVGNLAPRLDKDMQGVPPGFHYQLKLGDARDHELARHEAEIEHYVASLEAAKASGAGTTGPYNFYGTVGAVMTAPGATANISQNIGTDQRAALIQALKIAREAITAASTLPTQDKGELTEIVDSMIAEIERERPNTRRLSQGLQNIAATVQGIANGTQAYEAICAVANAIGIPL